MRKIAVDIFFCKRSALRQAIKEYMKYSEYAGKVLVCLGGETGLMVENCPTEFKLFSIQRRKNSSEVKVVVNTSRTLHN